MFFSPKVLYKILKIAIILASFIFIGFKLLQGFQSGYDFHVISFSKVKIALLLITLCLMFLNWGIEALKWKVLIGHIEESGFLKCTAAVLSGVTFSIFTPNRVGEFAGRILILKKGNRLKGILPSFLGSAAQLSITLLAGVMALVLIQKIIPGFPVPYSVPVSLTIFLAALAFTLLFFFNPDWVYHKIRKIRILKIRFEVLFDGIQKYRKWELFVVILLSMTRYLVFILQYGLVFSFFDLHFTFLQVFTSVSLIFIIMACLPFFALGDAGLRSSVALVVLGSLSENSAAIVSSSLLIWIINLMAPALIGSLIIWKTKIE